MKYIVDQGLQIPELKILFQSDIRLLRYKVPKSGNSITFFLFTSLFPKNLVANIVANYICIKLKAKSLWKDMMLLLDIYELYT